jgi:hypothetical protein
MARLACNDLSLDIQQQNSRKYLHMDSASDLESLRIAAAAAAKHDSADIETGTLSETNAAEHVTTTAASLQQQQQQDQAIDSHSLDIRSVLSTVSNPVVFSQCLLALLESLATGLVVVLLPAVMALPTWLVGVIYIAMVSHGRSVIWQLRTLIKRFTHACV